MCRYAEDNGLMFAVFPNKNSEMGRVYRLEENGNSFKVVTNQRGGTVQKMDVTQEQASSQCTGDNQY
jgi:hypothetical protein